MNILRKHLTRHRQPNRAPRATTTTTGTTATFTTTPHDATRKHQVAQHPHHVPPLSLSVR